MKAKDAIQFNVVGFAQDSNVTTVTMTVWDISSEHHALKFVGSARRDPRDKFNSDIGYDLAMARALERAAKHFSRQAEGAVKQADWIKCERLRRQATDPDGALAMAAAARWLDGAIPEARSLTPNFQEWLDGAVAVGVPMVISDSREFSTEEDNDRGDR